nr:putative disease resistance protein rga3 [Quercus suber]
MGKLINLRNILFDDDFVDIKIKCFPKGIERLTSLRTLGYFPVGVKGDEICKLGDIEHLNHIQGKLGIVGLKNVEDLGEVKNAFKNKIHLRALYLSFTIGYDQEATKERMEKDGAVLNALELDPHLEILEIGDYLGTKVDPNWMMSSLTYLKSLSLRGCWKLDHLPPLGKLPLLQVLTIKFAENVGKTGDEWSKISHIPHIKIRGKYVPRDDQLADIDSEIVDA